MYFSDIAIYVYREQSDKIDFGMCPSMDAIHIWQLLAIYSKANVHVATDFQYQAFSSHNKHDNHVATTVEVK